jgi:hypothetical protein
MNPHGDGKPEPTDPDQVLRLVELELAQRRIALQQAKSPYRAFRLASFVFLFAVMIGVALAFYYVFFSGGLDDYRTRTGARPSPTPSAHAP